MSQNQNSINSNELEENLGDIPSGISKQSGDNSKGNEIQSELNNQNSVIANGNGNNDQTTGFYNCFFGLI